MFANGDKNGKPRSMTGWRASCMYLWKNSGPCFLRPSGSVAYDSPDSENNVRNCVQKVDENGKPVMKTAGGCQNASADENNIIHNAPKQRFSQVVGPFSNVDDNGNEKMKILEYY